MPPHRTQPPRPGAARGAPTRRAGGPGRPSRISHDAVAEAVLEIGFDAATVKAVADRLGVSAAGLYHHVKGRDDLLRIATERMLAEDRLPPLVGQSWPAWLTEVALFLRQRLTVHPEMLSHYMSGAETPEAIAQLEEALAALARFGFSPSAAFDAFQAVGQLAVGAAFDALREQALTAAGRATVGMVHGSVSSAPTELPHVTALLEEGAFSGDRFAAHVELVLRGVATSRRESWSRANTRTPRPLR